MEISATTRRVLDGTVYIDIGSMEDASKVAATCNGNRIGDNEVIVTALTRQDMLDSHSKKRAFEEVILTCIVDMLCTFMR